MIRQFAAAALALTCCLPAATAVAGPVDLSGGDAFTIGGTGSTGPEVGPGLHRTTLAGDNTAQHFTIHKAAGQTLTVGAIIAPPDGQNAGMHIGLRSADGSACGTDSQPLSGADPGGVLIQSVVLDPGQSPRSPLQSDSCIDATTIVVEISTTVGGPTAAQILVTIEPRATGNLGTPDTTADLKVALPAAGQVRGSITPGKGIESAAVLQTGTTPSELPIGDWSIFKVRLGWGQSMAVSAVLPRAGSSYTPPADLKASIFVASPQWINVTSASNSAISNTGTVSASTAALTTIGSFLPRISWANRNLDTAGEGDYPPTTAQFVTSPGWYYIAVNIAPVSGSVPAGSRIPVQFNLDVIGQPVAGPSYVDADGMPILAPRGSDQAVVASAEATMPSTWPRWAGIGVVVLAALAVMAVAGRAWRRR